MKIPPTTPIALRSAQGPAAQTSPSVTAEPDSPDKAQHSTAQRPIGPRSDLTSSRLVPACATCNFRIRERWKLASPPRGPGVVFAERRIRPLLAGGWELRRGRWCAGTAGDSVHVLEAWMA